MAGRPPELEDRIKDALRSQYPAQPPTPHAHAYRRAIQNANDVRRESQSQKWNRRFREILERMGETIVDTADRLSIGQDAWVPEFRYNPDRMHRFDWANPARRIVVDIQGGTFGRQVTCHKCGAAVLRQLKSGGWQAVREGGGHSTGLGIANDAEKLNNATLLGFRIFIFTDRQMRDGSAERMIAAAVRMVDPSAAVIPRLISAPPAA